MKEDSLREQAKMKTWVYFMLEEKTNAVKIGTSHNAKQRLEELQPANPYKLTIIHEERGNRKTETEFHRRFKEYRLLGEWFEYSQEIKEYISDFYSQVEACGECTEEFEEELNDEFGKSRMGGSPSMKFGASLGSPEESPWRHNAVRALEDREDWKEEIK